MEAAPQPFESHIPIENGRQLSVIIISTFSIVIPSIFIGLRLWAKRVTSRPVDGSDWCIIAALVTTIGQHVDSYLMVLKGGMGFPTADIAVRFGPDVLTYFFKGIMSFCILWNVAICFSKLSVLWLYTILMPMESMLFPARTLAAFIILWNTGNILGQLLICKPFAANWNPAAGTCGSQRNFYFIMGVINIFTDVVMLALPVPFLYKLKLPMRKKLALIGMFTIGIMTCGVSVYRQVTLPSLEFSDMTFSGVPATIFSSLEPPVAITLACIPYLRPLLGRQWSSVKTSTYGRSGDSHGFSGTAGRKSNSRPFDTLDDASEVELQPTKPGFYAEASHESSKEPLEGGLGREAIRVETKWEVRSEA